MGDGRAGQCQPWQMMCTQSRDIERYCRSMGSKIEIGADRK